MLCHVNNSKTERTIMSALERWRPYECFLAAVTLDWLPHRAPLMWPSAGRHPIDAGIYTRPPLTWPVALEILQITNSTW